ncbi:MAG: diguanylate cyclase [Roseburia sp.]|nr:diguanylate cyclase [Roseburia sp.]
MKNIRRIYLILCGISVILLLYILAGFHREVNNTYEPADSVKQVDYALSIAPFMEESGVSLRGVIDPSDLRDRYIAFYTVHQNVSVTVGKETVYEVTNPGNFFGKTPGSGWNFVAIKGTYIGSVIEIKLSSPYAQTKDRIPDVFDGTRYSITKMILIRELPSLAICFVTLMIGVVILIYCSIIRKRGDVGRSVMSLTYLGTFATLLGIWSANESSCLSLIFGRSLFSTYLAYLSLMLMVLPFMLFTREMFADRENVIWKICFGMSLVDVGGSILLQLFQIYDFRETLWGMHLTCICFMFVVLYMTVKEARQGVLGREMKINVMSLFLIIFGFVADLVIYYATKGSVNIVGRVCFLAYIVILCYMFTREIAALTNKGREADMYHKLAFTDALTGVWNRTAYSRRIAQYDQEALEQAQVFVLDLNNLKWCNDNMGHQMGDNYIIRSATFVDNLFSENAKVYRIGGDEFCVLTSNMSMKEIQHIFEVLQETKIEVRVNGEGDVFYGRIACGFDSYREGDTDVYHIAKRADTKMYEWKRKIKEMDKGNSLQGC